MTKSSNLVQTHNQKKTFNMLVWHLIPSGYTIDTSCLSLCKLQRTVAEGPRTTFVANVRLSDMTVYMQSLTSVLQFPMSILSRTRKCTSVKTCSYRVCRRCWGSSPAALDWLKKTLGNGADKLRHTRSVAYSVVLVLLNKHQISYLHYYQTLFHLQVYFPDTAGCVNCPYVWCNFLLKRGYVSVVSTTNIWL